LLVGVASAAIDISDGLIGDLGHILEASGTGATLELCAIPRSTSLDRRLADGEPSLALDCLLAGGDDYELCFTAARERAAEIHAIAGELELPLTRIGTIEKRSGLVVVDEKRQALSSLPHAFDHFAR
jgi:thiamine-monophosphate kinase